MGINRVLSCDSCRDSDLIFPSLSFYLLINSPLFSFSSYHSCERGSSGLVRAGLENIARMAVQMDQSMFSCAQINQTSIGYQASSMLHTVKWSDGAQLVKRLLLYSVQIADQCWRRSRVWLLKMHSSDYLSWLIIKLLGTSIVSMETILTVSSAFADTEKSNFLRGLQATERGNVLLASCLVDKRCKCC